MKPVYLPKPIGSFPTRWTVVFNEQEFYHMQSMNVDVGYQDEWTLGQHGCQGIVHYYDRFIIVCLPPDVELSTIVHESVHVVQAMMDDANEKEPGREVFAYCVQYVYEQLVKQVERRKKCATETSA